MTYCTTALRRILLPFFLVLLSSLGVNAAVEDGPSSPQRNRLAIVIGNSDYQKRPHRGPGQCGQ